jgi:hypothetical protein
MINELERIWKEAVVTYFKVLSRRLPGWAEENHKILIQDNRPSDRDLNPRPPEYKAGLLLTRPRHSAERYRKKKEKEGRGK